MGCHFLLQGIFPTQRSNLGVPHCRQTLYHLSHQGSLKGKGYIYILRAIFALFTLSFSSVQFSSVAQLCPTLCDPMNHSTPGLPVHHQLLEFTQTHVHRVSDAIQPSHPLASPLLLPPIPPSIRVFSNESTLRMRWPKYWSFSFSIIPSKKSQG